MNLKIICTDRQSEGVVSDASAVMIARRSYSSVGSDFSFPVPPPEKLEPPSSLSVHFSLNMGAWIETEKI